MCFLPFFWVLIVTFAPQIKNQKIFLTFSSYLLWGLHYRSIKSKRVLSKKNTVILTFDYIHIPLTIEERLHVYLPFFRFLFDTSIVSDPVLSCLLMECRFSNDKAYPSELDNELPLKVNTDRTETAVSKTGIFHHIIKGWAWYNQNNLSVYIGLFNSIISTF